MRRLCVAAALVILARMAWAWPVSDAFIPYPSSYREWVHVKSALIDPKSPMAGRYGGLHHIYANEKAMEGYRTGQFQDGSIIVFDLLETQTNAGVTAEGARRFIDVMVRDHQQYGTTGGWGYEEFKGDSQTEQVLTTSDKLKCYNCH